jgi:muramoyltetrapeptide carboxypeptidase LdcA involved in peptidoglycan recycling
VGGNLSTLRNLLGTPYAPNLDGAVLLVEDTAAVGAKEFRRGLQALSATRGFGGLAAVLIGRFTDGSAMTPRLLDTVLDSLPAYDGVPCLADVDFGHTQPVTTMPIGGTLRVQAVAGAPAVVVEAYPNPTVSGTREVGEV